MDETKELLISLITLAEDQQKAVSTALEGLATEREALAKEREALRAALLQDLSAKTTLALKSAAKEATASLEEEQTRLAAQIHQATISATTITRALNEVVRDFSWRYLALYGAVAAGIFLAVLGGSWYELNRERRRAEELAAYSARLAAEVGAQEAQLWEWEQIGGVPWVEPCGDPLKRWCVRVDKKAGAFGDRKDLYLPLPRAVVSRPRQDTPPPPPPCPPTLLEPPARTPPEESCLTRSALRLSQAGAAGGVSSDVAAAQVIFAR